MDPFTRKTKMKQFNRIRISQPLDRNKRGVARFHVFKLYLFCRGGHSFDRQLYFVNCHILLSFFIVLTYFFSTIFPTTLKCIGLLFIKGS